MHSLGSLGEQHFWHLFQAVQLPVYKRKTSTYYDCTTASSKEGSSAGSSKENDGLSSSSDDEDVQVRNFPVASQLVGTMHSDVLSGATNAGPDLRVPKCGEYLSTLYRIVR